MSTADQLAAVVADLRPVANDLALPDTCQVRRKVAGALDSRGNPTFTETTLATSRCRLRTGQLRPQEKAVADQVQAIAPYAVDMPYGTNVNAADVLTIGSRRFEIVGVLEEGGYGVFTAAIVEERG